MIICIQKEEKNTELKFKVNRRLCYFNAFPDEETQYKFRKFGKFQLIDFSSSNFKDIFNKISISI